MNVHCDCFFAATGLMLFACGVSAPSRNVHGRAQQRQACIRNAGTQARRAVGGLRDVTISPGLLPVAACRKCRGRALGRIGEARR
jgi:hypothetical protein